METYHCTPKPIRLFGLLSIAAALIVIVAASAAIARDADGFYGPNSLKRSADVTLYSENEQGIPGFVSGRLSLSTPQGEEVAASLEYFQTNSAAYRMENPSQELRVRRVDEDPLGMRHVRFDQVYRGVRVVGGNLITHFASDGILKTVNGAFHPYIDIPVTPNLDSSDAVKLAGSDLLEIFGEATSTGNELVIFPWEDSTYLAWRIFLYSESPTGRWEYFVDALSGNIIYRANRIMNDAQLDAVGTGVGVMGDARNHIDVDQQGSTYYMYDYTRQAANNPHGHDGQMPPGNYIQTNITTTSLPGSIATDSDNVWNDPTIQAPAVDGHVYTGLFYDYLLHQFGRNGYDGDGASMLTVVNYSAEGDNNAYWDGRRIVVWSWSTGWRSLAGCPDVIAHEWGHAVTEFTSDLVYQKEPGALNESFSDMIGAAFEWAHDTMDVPDWEIGENGIIGGGGFRDMAEPHQKSDPDYYGPGDPYWVDVESCTPSYDNDYCGVHTNSGVGNKWFHLLSEGGIHYDMSVTGIGVENAIRIAYRANAFYWTSTTDYHDAALTTIAAANDLDSTGVWSARVARAWQAVGVGAPSPTLAFDYPAGTPNLLYPGDTTSFTVVVSGDLGGTPVPGTGKLHYSIDGEHYTSVSMEEQSANIYRALLPPLNCGVHVQYYVSADEVDFGTIADPDTTRPFIAIVATGSTVTFEDNFETNKNWLVSGTAIDGQWERAVPAGGGDRGDPPSDFDGSGYCFVTDNADDNSDVDDGTTILTSPTFAVNSDEARIDYARWYSNNIGADPHNDLFRVYISNNGGATWILLEEVGPSFEANGGWISYSTWLTDYLTPTSTMKLRFVASDLGSGSVIEAGVDAVRITGYECSISLPAIVSDSLPDWTVGIPYSRQLASSGGTGGHVWLDKFNDLDGTGLSLSANGLLSGTPVQQGPISFTAVVIDENNQTDERTLAFNINPRVSIVTLSLPDWTAGVQFTTALASDGGTGIHTWAPAGDGLAGSGLTLDLDGTLSGVPVSPGDIVFSVAARDEVGDSAVTTLSLGINPRVTIVTDSLPPATEGEAYSAQLAASGGTGELTWQELDGNLASVGLTLSSGGLITGSPDQIASISLTIRAADSIGGVDEATVTLIVKPAYVCGDVNNDGSGPDISDLTSLVNYLFVDGEAPPVLEAANVNGEGVIDISDLSLLVNHLFLTTAPLTCY